MTSSLFMHMQRRLSAGIFLLWRSIIARSIGTLDTQQCAHIPAGCFKQFGNFNSIIDYELVSAAQLANSRAWHYNLDYLLLAGGGHGDGRRDWEGSVR